MDFTGKVIVITGGARGIGKCMAREFEQRGALVCIIDILDNPYFIGDISQFGVLTAFADKVLPDYGHVDYLINNAMTLFSSLLAVWVLLKTLQISYCFCVQTKPDSLPEKTSV